MRKLCTKRKLSKEKIPKDVEMQFRRYILGRHFVDHMRFSEFCFSQFSEHTVVQFISSTESVNRNLHLLSIGKYSDCCIT